MTPIEVVVISGLITIAGSTLAWFLARRDKREDRAASSSTPGVPTVQEIWQRQDKMEKAFKASLILLGESVEQHENPGKLRFNKSAIKTLRESGYMPSELEDVLTA